MGLMDLLQGAGKCGGVGRGGGGGGGGGGGRRN